MGRLLTVCFYLPAYQPERQKLGGKRTLGCSRRSIGIDRLLAL
jgi:hypothetical protein